MPRSLFQQTGYTVGQKQYSEFEGDPVTASDSTDLPNGPTMGLYVTGSGNVNVNLSGGGTAVLTSLTAGQIVRICVSRVLSTSTTATGIVALYPAGNL